MLGPECVPVSHTDHPLRHFDRTCPACVEGARTDVHTISEGARTPDFHDFAAQHPEWCSGTMLVKMRAAFDAGRSTISASTPASSAEPLTPDWCMDAFWRVNPGRNAVVPSLYLLDFAREVLRVHGAARSSSLEQEPLSKDYVQTVPDKCDRIVWRNRYYHLPELSSPSATADKDAERYRWLNSKFELLLSVRENVEIAGGLPNRDRVYLRCGEPLDKWIDAQLEESRSPVDRSGA